ncbi:MAG: RNase adapter RapZ [Deltaproteobacteria bacterium]|nr:RNase adapter RapZ [Deltaproteobacteria bacterium]
MTAPSDGMIVVVTGMSGAGRSTALRALDDLSFYTIDNLPVPLFDRVVDLVGAVLPARRVALGMDVRVREFLDGATGALEALRGRGFSVSVYFLDTADDVLVRRYSESRRPHPLSGLFPAEDLLRLIQREREALGPLRALADRVVDTSRLTVHELRRLLLDSFSGAAGTTLRMTTRFVSFGFKYGVPVDADTVFDARFLPNPHFVPELRPRSGKDPDVSGYVLNTAEGGSFRDAIAAYLEPLLPLYAREGKVVLTVAVGCTGGRHRSVALAEALGARFRDRCPGDVVVAHRDIDRGG